MSTQQNAARTRPTISDRLKHVLAAATVLVTVWLATLNYSERLARVETQVQAARTPDVADRLDRIENRVSVVETNVLWIRQELERRSRR